jgi:hypothetical protein
MTDVSRRSFLAPISGALAAAAAGRRAHGQLIYQRSDWNVEDFQRLTVHAARIKQLYDINNIGNGRCLNSVKNSLNGLEFGFGIPAREIQIVGAFHGPANLLNFDDSMWQKYHFGEIFQVTDPETNKPAIRNPFHRSRMRATTSRDLNDENSSLQDMSLEGLHSRGVRFLCCHTATEEQARLLIQRLKLNQQPEQIVKDLLNHVHPGALVVPSMVAAIAVLQSDGRYSYVTI